jgi:hypothetical protein
MLQGLLVVGTFDGVHQVTRKDGSAVDGLFRIDVGVGTPYPRTATFSEVDRDTGEPTPVYSQLAKLSLRPSERIAVKVSTRVSKGYANLTAVAVFALDREPSQVQ